MQESATANEPRDTGRQSAVIEVSRADLPVHCPLDDSKLWNSHPRVFIPLEAGGEAACPYCGTRYKLVD
ncbi:MAG: zinc-finger domain-containing protein [Gammaproteobacteria bacterium]|nr:zinc-finger domain-containing protein [Gammaproteobacteria bacterium]